MELCGHMYMLSEACPGGSANEGWDEGIKTSMALVSLAMFEGDTALGDKKHRYTQYIIDSPMCLRTVGCFVAVQRRSAMFESDWSEVGCLSRSDVIEKWDKAMQGLI